MSKINNIAVKDILNLQITALCDDDTERIINLKLKDPSGESLFNIDNGLKHVLISQSNYLIVPTHKISLVQECRGYEITVVDADEGKEK